MGQGGHFIIIHEIGCSHYLIIVWKVFINPRLDLDNMCTVQRHESVLSPINITSNCTKSIILDKSIREKAISSSWNCHHYFCQQSLLGHQGEVNSFRLTRIASRLSFETLKQTVRTKTASTLYPVIVLLFTCAQTAFRMQFKSVARGHCSTVRFAIGQPKPIAMQRGGQRPRRQRPRQRLRQQLKVVQRIRQTQLR